MSKISNTCKICGVVYLTYPSQRKATCSKACHDKYRSSYASRIKTADEIDKIRKRNKGRKVTEESKEKNRLAHLGKTHTYITRLKMGESRSGDKHHAWLGGVSFGKYCEKFNGNFKERTRIFFGCQCVECGTPQNGKKLVVHHVHYDKKMCCNGSPKDVVALCHSCHSKTNFNRDYWEQHFTEILYTYYGGKCFLTKEEALSLKIN